LTCYVSKPEALVACYARAIIAVLDQCDTLQRKYEHGTVVREAYTRGLRTATKAVRAAICNVMDKETQ